MTLTTPPSGLICHSMDDELPLPICIPIVKCLASKRSKILKDGHRDPESQTPIFWSTPKSRPNKVGLRCLPQEVFPIPMKFGI